MSPSFLDTVILDVIVLLLDPFDLFAEVLESSSSVFDDKSSSVVASAGHDVPCAAPLASDVFGFLKTLTGTRSPLSDSMYMISGETDALRSEAGALVSDLPLDEES